MGYPAARKCSLDNPALRQAGWELKTLPGAANEVSVVAPGGGCLTVQGAGFPGGANLTPI